MAAAIDSCKPHKAQEFQDRLELARPTLVAAEVAYDQHGNAETLFQIAASNAVVGPLSGDEMLKLYTQTFSRKGTASRDLYDKLKQGAPNGICPLCGAQQVKTLDHYLAKTAHALYTITPLNLVPACSDCNTAKLTHQAQGAGDQHLHPYFDDVDDEQWLFAEVVEASPAALIYSAKRPASWSAVKGQRVAQHFAALNHAHLFASLSSDHLPSMRYRLRSLMGSAGAYGVRAHLQEELRGHQELRRNSWQIAMFAALGESDWYCEGGFDA